MNYRYGFVLKPTVCGQFVCGQATTGNMYVGAANEDAWENFAGKPTLTHSNGATSAVTNLYSGMFKLETNAISFGSGPMAISFAMIYNSRMNGDVIYTKGGKNYCTYMGDGFKLNLQQYLIELPRGTYDENGDEFRFHYIDGSGTKHDIVQNGNVLYDTSGLGIILDSGSFGGYYGAGGAAYRLTDRQGNMLFFDSLGRIVATRSVFYSANKYEYENSTTKLIAVTTAALTTVNAPLTERTARLFYNIFNMLDRIEYDETYNGATRTSDNNPIVSFQYDGYSLIEISKNKKVIQQDRDEGETAALNTVVSRIIAKFEYNNGVIRETSDCGGQILGLYRRNGKVYHISEGAYGSNGQITSRSNNYIEYLSNTQTEVMNSKNVCILYNMNEKGEMYSAVEAKGNYYYAISPKPDGYGYGQYFPTELSDGAWSVTGTAAKTGNGFFNQKDVVKLESGYNACIYTTIIDCGLMNRESQNSVYAQTFTFSCWAEIDTALTTKGDNLAMELYVQYKNSQSERFGKQFDPKLKGWQFICFSARVIDDEVTDAKVRIYNKNTGAPLYLADARMVLGGLPQNWIQTNYSSSPYDMEKLGSIGLVKEDNSFEKIIIGNETEFTVADAEQTRKNYYLANPSGGYNPYSVVFNNGKRLISGVKSFTVGTGTSAPNANNIYLTRLDTAQFSGVKDDIRIDSFTNYAGAGGGKHKAITHVTANRLNGNGQWYDEKDSETTEVGFDGLPIYRNDSYGVKTTYKYDIYGNMERVKMQGTDGSVSYLDSEYQADGEHVTESWDSRYSVGKGANNSVSSVFQNPMGLLSSVTLPKEDGAAQKDRKTIFGYNAFKDKLNWVKSENFADRNDISYNAKGQIETLTHNDTDFGIEYDIHGRANRFTAAGTEILRKDYTNVYLSESEETIYANGYTQTGIADKYGFHTEIHGTGFSDTEITFSDKNNNVSSAAQIRNIEDRFNGSQTDFGYNLNDKLMSYKTVLDNNFSIKVEETEPETPSGGMDQSLRQAITIKDGNTEKGIFINKASVPDNKVLQPRISQTISEFWEPNAGAARFKSTTDYTYDGLGRPKKIDRETGGTNSNLMKAYCEVGATLTYCNNSTNSGTTEYIETQTINTNSSAFGLTSSLNFDYTYHPDGRINTVTKTGTRGEYDPLSGNVVLRNVNSVCGYTYDKLGRLSAYTKNGVTSYFHYDAGGNMTSKIGGGSASFGYYHPTWKDLLTHWNSVSQNIFYDTCGNPTTYKDNPVAWMRGRLLESYKGATYTYNKDGLRTGKTANGTTTKYLYDGNKLVSEYRQTGGTVEYIYYLYDAAGLTGFIVEQTANGNKTSQVFTVVTDTFGTVHEIRNNINYLIASYDYDQWGKCTVTNHFSHLGGIEGNLGNINPFRWKGHYYDTTSNFYYINGNWYDTDTGRFINAGSVNQLMAGAGTVNGLNLFTFNLNDQTNAAGNAVNFESAYDLTPELSRRYTKRDRFWRIFTICALAYLAYLGVVAAIFTAGQSLVLTGACVAGIIGIVLTGLGGLIILANAAANIAEAFSAHGYNFMRDGLCGGNMTAYRAVAITGVVLMIAGSIFTAYNTAVNQPLQMADDCLKGELCFIAGTLVLTEDGDKKIEDIEIGDKVLAYDEETGEQALKKVTQLYRNTTTEWYHIEAVGEEIVCTAEHPFYVVGKGFIPARALNNGDKFLLKDGQYAILESIWIEQLAKPETTYNIEVAGFHTYYVSKQGVLVHNKCAPDSPQKLSDYQLKKAGIQEHSFKNAALKATKYSKMPVSRFDIYVDKVDDLLWLGTKKGQFQIWIETGTKLLL